MLNEQKIRKMVEIARFEQEAPRRVFRTAHFFRDDYVSFQVIKAMLGGFFALCLLAALWVFYHSEELMWDYTVMDLWGVVLKFAAVALGVVLACGGVAFIIYLVKYQKDKNKLRRYRINLKQLLIMEEEEKEQSSGDSEGKARE